jgi:hypothetical protein
VAGFTVDFQVPLKSLSSVNDCATINISVLLHGLTWIPFSRATANRLFFATPQCLCVKQSRMFYTIVWPDTYFPSVSDLAVNTSSSFCNKDLISSVSMELNSFALYPN